MDKDFKAMDDLVRALRMKPEPTAIGSALQLEDLDVSMTATTYSWQLGSKCSVYGKRSVIVNERKRKRSGTWYQVWSESAKVGGDLFWVHWKRIGFDLSGKSSRFIK